MNAEHVGSSELQVQGAIQCFFQATEADEISHDLTAAFHNEATPDEQNDASGIIHTVFEELRKEATDIAKDLLKAPVEAAINQYVVLRVIKTFATRLAKGNEKKKNSLISWLSSALEKLQTLLDAKPQTKSVSTMEAAENLGCTKEQAEVALKAALLVKMHDDWVPPVIVLSHHDEAL